VAYRLLTGRYVIRYPEAPGRGPEPDGDTLKFRPDDPTLVEDLGRASGVEPDLSAQHRISLRLEAVDALETHFAGTNQDPVLGFAARDALLAFAGFRDVVFDPARPSQVRSANADDLPGWVLSNGVEGNGRLVSFAFTGTPPLADGATIELDETMLRASANADLLARGLAYPLLYTTLPVTLRDLAVSISRAARADGVGVWERSTADPNGAADVSGGTAALRELVIWPKLFRRLVSFFAVGQQNIAGFGAWLRANPAERDDAVMLLDTGQFARLHDLVTVAGPTIALNRWPDSFVILPAGAPGPVPIPQPPAAQRVGAVRIVAALVDPFGVDAGSETVTVLNTTGRSITLDGWTLSDTHNDIDLLDGQIIGAGDALRVRLTKVLLGNTGDTIVLRDPTGAVIDRVGYTAAEAPERAQTLVF